MVSLFRRRKDSDVQLLGQNILDKITLDTTKTLVIELDIEGIITSIHGDLQLSPSFEFLVGQSFKNIILPDEVNRFSEMLNTVLNGGIKISEHITLNHDQLQVDLSFFPDFSENGVIKGVHCLVTNVHLKHEPTLLSNHNIQKFLTSSHEFTGLLDTSGRILHESFTSQNLLGYDPYHVKGEYFTSYIHKEDEQTFWELINEVKDRPYSSISTELKIKDNADEWHTFEATFTNLLNETDIGAILYSCRDITEFKKQQSKITYLSTHDQFTGLPNRRAFEEKVDLEVKLATIYNQSFGVIYLKLDGFEYLNNVMGSSLTDQFIEEFSLNVTTAFNRKVEMLCKSDETSFYILTKSMQDSSLIIKFVEDLLDHLKAPTQFQQYNISLTSKVGVSIFPHTCTTTNELLINSKSVSYLADTKGGTNYRVTSQTDLEVVKRLFSLRNDLKFSLHRQQFKMLYKPIFHAKTGLIEYVEAVLRWEHPVYGTITPKEFIHVAAEYDLIDSIGEWALQTVFTNLSQWHNNDYYVRAAINFSPKQLDNPNFIPIVQKVLAETQIDPQWIHLEITEQCKFNDINTLKKIRSLQEMGFHISLDDFGTGYNSLKNLQLIKPDTIKIEKSFIKDLLTDSNSESIISSIMHMAKNLSIQVVAAGVETIEQKNFLLSEECDYLQGPLFSRPVSLEVMEKLLKKQWGDPIPTLLDGKEQRKYFRIPLVYPLEANMTVSELNGKKIEVSKTSILIDNIGPGGLRFISNIHLPVEANFVLNFEVKIFGEIHSLHGSIVHSFEKQQLRYYGVKLRMTENQRDKYISILNNLQLKLKKSPTLPDHLFYLDNIHTYFKR
ncbi:EAL domain-containing protein [Sporosarcina obsidiansis]|uniref:EAL domain-containing protein n=1 Tax=Sporosarcina obsidiansis TaxID=2660748 RepID=UPI00129B05E8|nr:EAL domain-containing protein [Sporosarcina obsidiansis]